MTKKEALAVLWEIEDNVEVCCAVTMEQEEVIELIEKIRSYMENGKQT